MAEIKKARVEVAKGRVSGAEELRAKYVRK